MTTFRAALTRLAGLSVTGVVHNYDVDAVPDTLTRAQLPALLVLPATTADGIAAGQGQGFEATAFANGSQTARYTVNHLLLLAPTQSGGGTRSHIPSLIDLIDNYFAALGLDVTLNSALLEATHVTVTPGIFKHGSVEYHGCLFQHTWLMEV